MDLTYMNMNFENWIAIFALFISILSLAVAVYSIYWSRKSFKIQHNNGEYRNKIEMYKKLQDFFESERNYNKSDVKIFGGSVKRRDFIESGELFIKEVKDIFGDKIGKKVQSIVDLCSEARSVDNEIASLIDFFDDHFPSEGLKFRDQIRMLHTEETTNEQIAEIQESLRNFCFANYNRETGECDQCNYLEYEAKLEGLNARINEEIQAVNNDLLSLINYHDVSQSKNR